MNNLTTIPTPDIYINNFLKTLDNVSTRTTEEYKKDILYFFKWIQANNETLSGDILRKYREYLKANHKSIFTINTYLNACKRFFDYLYQMKIIPLEIRVKKYKAPQGYCKEPLSTAEAQALIRVIQAADSMPLIKLRDMAIVNLMLRTGLRIASIHHCDTVDIKQKLNETVLYYRGKGREGKFDFVVLTKEASQPILDYMAESKHTGALFISHGNRSEGRLSLRGIRSIFEHYLNLAGITDKSTHSARHFAAQCALDSGATVIQVKDMLAHQSIESTMKYVRNTDRLNKCAEKMVRF